MDIDIFRIWLEGGRFNIVVVDVIFWILEYSNYSLDRRNFLMPCNAFKVE